MTNTTLKIPSKLIEQRFTNAKGEIIESEIDFMTFRKRITDRLARELDNMGYNSSQNMVAARPMSENVIQYSLFHDNIGMLYKDLTWHLVHIDKAERDEYLINLFLSTDIVTVHQSGNISLMCLNL